MERALAMMATPGDYSQFPGASDVALPGESVEADPYGALALIEGTGQTVAPPLSQLVAQQTAAPSATAALPAVLTNTFTVGGFQIPYWAVGAALIGWYVVSRRK
jgi:hypothetical protein